MLVPGLRVILLYMLAVFAIRFMGKRQVGEMQPAELVTTILISAVAAVPIQDPGIPLLHGVVPVLVLVCCEVLLSAAGLRFYGLRRLLSGRPLPVVREGRLLMGNLKRMRLSVEDVLEDLRLAGVFDLSAVQLAQVETNGRLSVLVSRDQLPPSAADLGLALPEEPPLRVLVTDGRVIRENLTGEMDEAWLKQQTDKLGGLRGILLLCADGKGRMLVQKREKDG